MVDERNGHGANLGELPKGWAWTTLGNVCSAPQYGWTTSAATEGNLHLLRTTDITSGKVDWNSVPFCKDEPPEKEKYLLRDGDIVISRAGSVGFSYLLKEPKEAVFASYLIRFKPLTAEKYVAYFLQSSLYWQSISDQSLGIAIPNVNASKLKQISLPLAPFAEQHRIVTKIEELFSDLDAGVATLQKVKAQLKRYRQAVLKAAVDGKLTAEWRAVNAGKIEPASVLVERIRGERAKNANGKAKPLPQVDAAELPELPEGWCWTKLGMIFDVTIGGTPSREKKQYWDGEIPWVSSGEVAFNRIRDAREHITVEGLTNSNAKLHPPGTVLLAMIGEGKTRGQPAILNIAATTNQNIASILCSPTPVPPDFVFHWLAARYEESRKSSSGGMQYALNSARIRDFPFPLPPIAEQHQIIAEVERRLSVTVEIEKTIDQSLKQAERLRQSILKRAFAGKLVSQDANDEPAEKLLERIRVAREKGHAPGVPQRGAPQRKHARKM